jgi:transcriptional regulator with XRE-family HTH domain
MASAEEVNIAKKVAALLGSDFFEGEDAGSQGKGFRGLLRAAMHPDLAGSGAGLARVIGVSTATMSGWLSGKHLPSLGQAIATAEALNLTLEEALTGRGSVRLIVRGALAKKEKDKEREAQKPKVAWLSKKELRAAMERLSLVEPPMSLVAMARAIGTSARELRRREKDLSREIARRSKEWKEKRAVERWKARQARISALAAKVAEEGLRATRRRLEERMGDSLVFLLNSEFPKEVFDDAETALT